MTQAQIAEWILAQVLPSEESAAVIGDLAEDVGQRGNLWFWSCVFRLAGARIWQDLSGSPAKMALLGLSGFLENARAPIACMLFTFVLPLLGGNGDIRLRHDWAWTLLMRNVAKPHAPPEFELQWPVRWAFTLLCAAWTFRTGRRLARHAPGRNMAACLAVALVGWIAILAAEIASAQGAVAGRFSFALSGALAHDLALFAGAIRTRRQRKQTA